MCILYICLHACVYILIHRSFYLFTWRYLWSGLIVVLGIYLNLYSKNKQSWDAHIDSLLRRLGLRQQHWQLGTENIVWYLSGCKSEFFITTERMSHIRPFAKPGHFRSKQANIFILFFKPFHFLHCHCALTLCSLPSRRSLEMHTDSDSVSQLWYFCINRGMILWWY